MKLAGLRELLTDHAERDRLRPVVALLAAARRGLALDEIAAVLPAARPAVEGWIATLGGTVAEHHGRWTFSHHDVGESAWRLLGEDTVAGERRRLFEFFDRRAPGEAGALAEWTGQALAAQAWARVVDLLSDLARLECRYRAGQADDVREDLWEAEHDMPDEVGHARPDGVRVVRATLGALREALRRRRAFLARRPACLFQTLFDEGRGSALLAPLLEGWRAEFEARAGQRWLRARSPDAASSAATRPHPGTVRELSFSPDGARLASVGDGEVCVWDVATGARLAAWEAASSTPVRWSPDGRALVTAGPAGAPGRGAAAVWDAASGRRICGMSAAEADDVGVWFGIGGRHVFLEPLREPGETACWELDTGARVEPAPAEAPAPPPGDPVDFRVVREKDEVVIRNSTEDLPIAFLPGDALRVTARADAVAVQTAEGEIRVYEFRGREASAASAPRKASGAPKGKAGGRKRATADPVRAALEEARAHATRAARLTSPDVAALSALTDRLEPALAKVMARREAALAACGICRELPPWVSADLRNRESLPQAVGRIVQRGRCPQSSSTDYDDQSDHRCPECGALYRYYYVYDYESCGGTQETEALGRMTVAKELRDLRRLLVKGTLAEQVAEAIDDLQLAWQADAGKARKRRGAS